ncbi:MAG: hypothetical protein Kow0068_04750 [Marinilabiliales bacterium]
MQKLSDKEKNTFILHVIHSAIEGIISGVFVLNGFIFVENLKGSLFELGILFTFSWGVYIILAFTNVFISRVENQNKLLIYTALITRLPVMLFLLFPSEISEIAGVSLYNTAFLLIIMMFFLGAPIIKPAVNQYLKNTYHHDNFGRLFGYATGIQKVTTFIATLLFGLVMDIDKTSFKYVYPVVGIMGVLSIVMLTRIKYEHIVEKKEKTAVLTGVKDSVMQMIRILKNDKPYLFFQFGFLFYGIAFMITDSVVTKFFSDYMDANSSAALYKNIALVITIILLPNLGRSFGKTDPRKFGIFTFMFLAFYILFVMLTEYFPFHTIIFGLEIYYLLVIAFIFNGLFMSTMHLLWNIGSAYFCKPQDAGIYHSVHLVLTGLRAVIFPTLGIIIYKATGYSFTFAVGIICLITGMIILYWSKNKFKIKV